MRKTAMALVMVMVVLIGYGGLKAIDLGTDFAAQMIARNLYGPAPIHQRESYDTVTLPCTAATDSDVVRTGRQAISLMERGFTVKLCGRVLTYESAVEMSEY